MKYLPSLFKLASLFLLFFVSCGTTPRQLSVAQNVGYSQHVVRLQSEPGKLDLGSGYATGFAITQHHIITAGHFCKNVEQVTEKDLSTGRLLIQKSDEFGNLKETGKADIVAFTEEKDICLLYSENHGIPPLRLAKNTDSVYTEDEIVVVGAPSTSFPFRRHGRIVSVIAGERVENFKNMMMLSVDIEPGSSGSPVIREGEVIGVVTILLMRPNNAALAERVEYIYELLEDNLIFLR